MTTRPTPPTDTSQPAGSAARPDEAGQEAERDAAHGQDRSGGAGVDEPRGATAQAEAAQVEAAAPGGAGGGHQGASRRRRRAPAGAAVLRAEKTEAIQAAVFEELAAVGYARMSIEGIARRAGVGKTAVYRRWRSKLHLVLDLVSALAVQGLPTPDTGSLEGDLRLLYELTARALRHPIASQIIPDLQAEAARNPDMAEALQKALREGQHSVASGIVRAAAARGELRADLDEDLALDLISGPLYWRAVVMRGKPPKGYLARLAGATTAGLRAL